MSSIGRRVLTNESSAERSHHSRQTHQQHHTNCLVNYSIWHASPGDSMRCFAGERHQTVSLYYFYGTHHHRQLVFSRLPMRGDPINSHSIRLITHAPQRRRPNSRPTSRQATREEMPRDGGFVTSWGCAMSE